MCRVRSLVTVAGESDSPLAQSQSVCPRRFLCSNSNLSSLCVPAVLHIVLLAETAPRYL